MHSYISSIGTATPKHKYSQDELLSFMSKAHGALNGSEVKLRALYRATGIKYRYSVLSDYGESSKDFKFYPKNNELEPFPGTARRMDVYQREALKLSHSAAKKCLDKLEKFSPKEITHLITVSCTGFYAPGLDIDLIHQLGLNTHVKRTGINYMGCYAAITALRNANSIVRADNKAKVLIICVELCSLHFQKNDTEDNRLANSLFGDGAAAMLVEGKRKQSIQLEAINFSSELLPNGSKDMAWSVGDLGFEMKLSTYVPDVIRQGLSELGNTLLNNQKVSIDFDKIKYFAIHPGGKKILESVEDEIQIPKEKNLHAYEVLRNYGNMSSPTIVFVLNEIYDTLTPSDEGEHIFCMAFGPGLTLESALIRIVANG